MESNPPVKFLQQQNQIQILLRNRHLTEYYSEEKRKLEELTKSLDIYLKKVRHDVFVNIGTKAMMRGNILHTNDVLVSLGSGYFVKVSSFNAKEIASRRIKDFDKKLEDLDKEKNFVENQFKLPEMLKFVEETKNEIVEEFDEKEEEEWRKKHREKVREHKKKLREIREHLNENKQNETDDDLFKHLDLLEMQEELEDEINRLEGSEGEEDGEDEDEEEDGEDEEEHQEDEDREDHQSKINKVVQTIQNIAISDTVKEVGNKPMKIINSENARPTSKFKLNRNKT